MAHTQKTTYRIAMFGTFDVDNYGDCLFPLILEYHFTKRLGEIELYRISPTNNLPRIANYSKVYSFKKLHDIFSVPPSCFVIGGGELLRTAYGFGVYHHIKNLLYPYALECWLLPIMLADQWRCPSFLNAVGTSFIDEDFLSLTKNYLSKVAQCFVRDPFTAEWLSQINISSQVVPDSGVSVPDLLAQSDWASLYRKLANEFKLPSDYLIAQCSLYLRENHKDFTESVVDVAKSTGLPVLLLPICHNLNDIVSLKIMRKIFRMHKIKTYLIGRHLNTLQTSSILANSRMYIGTSLHGAIVTLAFGRPAVSFSLSVRGKHKGVLSVMDLDVCHTSRANEVVKKAKDLLAMPQEYFDEKTKLARHKVEKYYDEMCEIVKSPNTNNVSTAKNWRQNTTTGEISFEKGDEFDEVKRLCLLKKQDISVWKNWIYYFVRKNSIISEYYDRFMLWIRQRNR